MKPHCLIAHGPIHWKPAGAMPDPIGLVPFCARCGFEVPMSTVAKNQEEK